MSEINDHFINRLMALQSELFNRATIDAMPKGALPDDFLKDWKLETTIEHLDGNIIRCSVQWRYKHEEG